MNDKHDTCKKLLTVSEASKELGIGKSATYRLVWAEKLRHIRLGKKILIPFAELDAFIQRELEGLTL